MSDQGKPGRYSRSFNGLIASMVVIVLVVVAFVAVRSLISDNPDVKPQNIDYQATVSELQGNGFDPVYPAKLPASWMATSYTFTPGKSPDWGLSMLTGAGHYVGIEQSPDEVGDLLSTYVNGDATSMTAYDSPGGLASRWAGWSGSDGDHAYSATVGDDHVIVFGSAPLADLQLIVRTITRAKLTSLSPTPTPGATQTF